MRVVLANFSKPNPNKANARNGWRWQDIVKPQKPRQVPLLQQKQDWGFHIYSIGVYLMEKEIADEVEFWDYAGQNLVQFHSSGVLRVLFLNEQDVADYLECRGAPDLFINYGRHGTWLLRLLENRSFRVHIPCLRKDLSSVNTGAECYLVDAEEYLDDYSMLYIPVVNLAQILPGNHEKLRDFIYIASLYPGKCHDMLLDVVRGTELTGHLHPVDPSALDLADTRVTATNFNETDFLRLLQTSRIAVYPAGKETSNPAAMWECVAADLPIVVNEEIEGGKHVVVPGVTGEVSSRAQFLDVMRTVLRNRNSYRPREYFEKNWNTLDLLQNMLISSIAWAFPCERIAFFYKR